MLAALRSLPAFAAALALTLAVAADASPGDLLDWSRDDAGSSRVRSSRGDCVDIDFDLSTTTGCKSVSRIMRNGLGVKTENGTLIRLVIDPSVSSNLEDEICVTPLEEVSFVSGESSRWGDAVLVESDGRGDAWLRNASLQVEFTDRRDVELVWGSADSDRDRDSRRASREICELPFSLDHSDHRIDLFGYHHAGTTLEIPIDGPGVYAIWSGNPGDLDLGDTRNLDDDDGRHDIAHSRGEGKKKGHDKHHDDDDDDGHDDDDDEGDDD